MLSTACYESRAYEKDSWPSASTLAWPILDAERFPDLSFDLLVQAGMKMGLTQKRARDRLVAMQADILNEAKALLEATESEIGRAHVATPVTNAPHVCRHLLETKKHTTTYSTPTSNDQT